MRIFFLIALLGYTVGAAWESFQIRIGSNPSHAFGVVISDSDTDRNEPCTLKRQDRDDLTTEIVAVCGYHQTIILSFDNSFEKYGPITMFSMERSRGGFDLNPGLRPKLPPLSVNMIRRNGD
jgi:hypothetical protein